MTDCRHQAVYLRRRVERVRGSSRMREFQTLACAHCGVELPMPARPVRQAFRPRLIQGGKR